jgi:hypothetical protein
VLLALEEDGEQMGAALGLVELVGDYFEGEAGCNRTLDSSQRSSVSLALVFQLALRESFKSALRESFKRFAWLGRLGSDKEGRGARAVTAGVLSCVDSDEAGSMGDVAEVDVEVGGDSGRKGDSAKTAGEAIAAGDLLLVPGLFRGVGGGVLRKLELSISRICDKAGVANKHTRTTLRTSGAVT